MKKFIVITILSAGIGLLGWQIYVKASATKNDFQRNRGNVPVAVEVAPVRKADIRNVGQYTGSLYPLSEYTVAPKVSGRLEKMLFHIGDMVQSGDLVAVLDDDEYHQQVLQAEAELEVTRANLLERQDALDNAKREYDRTVALRQKKIASESELDSSESEYRAQQSKLKVAIAQVAQKDAALKMARVRLSYSQVRIPQSNHGGHWVVGERFVHEGALLAPNDAIVTILNIGTLIAAIHVIERDYPSIRPNLAALITTDAFPGQTFQGKVLRIAPMMKEKSREARVEIEVPNEKMTLKPGMFVKVQIEFDTHEDSVVVPAAALIKREGSQGVFLADLKENKARFVPVTVGIVNGVNAEILDPPLSGEVVTLGQHLLEDGSTILLPGKTPAGGGPEREEKPGVARGKVSTAGEKS
ncbi:MAG: efflux RND transporter periplasmic adaptor subunit [Desulfobacteraceae bacterium]|nr:MAG: efflux RND transporter periplasmic adaptor subunit [Desulfobacteraceae bacterium]